MIEKMDPCQTKVTLGRCKGTNHSVKQIVFNETTVTREITCNKCKAVTTVSISIEPSIQDALAVKWNEAQAAKAGE